jgi:hypothetical protein
MTLALAQLSQDEQEQSAGQESGQSHSHLRIHRRPLETLERD